MHLYGILLQNDEINGTKTKRMTAYVICTFDRLITDSYQYSLIYREHTHTSVEASYLVVATTPIHYKLRLN